MLKIYKTGRQFLTDNKEILDKYPLETVFFGLNASVIEQTNSNDFLLKYSDGDNFLIAVHNADYPMVIFGSESLCAEFAHIAFELGLSFKKVLGSLATCEKFLAEYEKFADCTHKINHAMDIMRCEKTLTVNTENVERATEDDAEELLTLSNLMSKEAMGENLSQTDVNEFKKRIKNFALIRADGKIVSIACKMRETDRLTAVSGVYTLPQYRCRGYSCNVVTFLTKEVIGSGKIAYLFVDKTNPISNHLYTKIGYTYVAPQYEISLLRNS